MKAHILLILCVREIQGWRNCPSKWEWGTVPWVNHFESVQDNTEREAGSQLPQRPFQLFPSCS